MRVFPVFTGTTQAELEHVLEFQHLGGHAERILTAYQGRKRSQSDRNGGADLYCKPNGSWALVIDVRPTDDETKRLREAVQKTHPGIDVRPIYGFNLNEWPQS